MKMAQRCMLLLVALTVACVQCKNATTNDNNITTSKDDDDDDDAVVLLLRDVVVTKTPADDDLVQAKDAPAVSEAGQLKLGGEESSPEDDDPERDDNPDQNQYDDDGSDDDPEENDGNGGDGLYEVVYSTTSASPFQMMMDLWHSEFLRPFFSLFEMAPGSQPAATIIDPHTCNATVDYADFGELSDIHVSLLEDARKLVVTVASIAKDVKQCGQSAGTFLEVFERHKCQTLTIPLECEASVESIHAVYEPEAQKLYVSLNRTGTPATSGPPSAIVAPPPSEAEESTETSTEASTDPTSTETLTPPVIAVLSE